MVWRGLAWLGKWAEIALILSLGLAVLLPWLANILRDWLSIIVLVMLTVPLMRLDGGALLRREWRNPRQIIIILVLMLVATPILIALIVPHFTASIVLLQGLVIASASPTLISVSAIGFLLGLDSGLAMLLIVLATLLAPLTIPLIVATLLGIDLAITPLALGIRMGGILLGAILLATLIRRIVGLERITERGKSLDGVTVIMMAIFAIAVFDGVGVALLERPGTMLTMAGVAFAFCLALQGIGYGCARVIFWISGFSGEAGATRNRLATIALCWGYRNMALAFAALPAGTELNLYFAMMQLPIYLMPFIVRVLYGRNL